MLDRTIQPKIHEIKSLVLPEPTQYVLDNGLRVFETNLGTQDVLKLELVFYAGRPVEQHPLVGRVVASMLREGTRHHTSAQIAEKFDFLGSTFSAPFTLDTTNVMMFCLGRHFEALLPLLTEVVTEPAFPQKELDLFIKQNQQRLQMDLNRSDVVAYRMLTEFIFGKDHVYGYNSTPELYTALDREQIVTHFEQNFHAQNCDVMISGKVTPKMRTLLNEHLGQLPRGVRKEVQLSVKPRKAEQHRVTHEDKLQSAIRIGRHLFNRQHPDYPGMYVLNTILGGYFGSRLMKNIREEKGYTYGIYSSLDAMQYDGYFSISTEVGTEHLEATLEEIYREIDLLRNELVSGEELKMVRNYLMGALMTGLDGPLNIAEIVKAVVADGLPFSSFQDLLQTIQTITPVELKALAQKYLQRDDLWEIVVGDVQ